MNCFDDVKCAKDDESSAAKRERFEWKSRNGNVGLPRNKNIYD